MYKLVIVSVLGGQIVFKRSQAHLFFYKKPAGAKLLFFVAVLNFARVSHSNFLCGHLKT